MEPYLGLENFLVPPGVARQPAPAKATLVTVAMAPATMPRLVYDVVLPLQPIEEGSHEFNWRVPTYCR